MFWASLKIFVIVREPMFWQQVLRKLYQASVVVYLYGSLFNVTSMMTIATKRPPTVIMGKSLRLFLDWLSKRKVIQSPEASPVLMLTLRHFFSKALANIIDLLQPLST